LFPEWNKQRTRSGFPRRGAIPEIGRVTANSICSHPGTLAGAAGLRLRRTAFPHWSLIRPQQSLESIQKQEASTVAVNKPLGDNARKGAVRKRSQFKTKTAGEEHWTKRSRKSGRLMDVKKDDAKFKGVRREKAPSRRSVG
jgi:hypothetical protein